MKKILPIQYPPITSWVWHANLFSILYTDERTLPWIYSNYLQMSAHYFERGIILDFTPHAIDYCLCPWLEIQILSRKSIKEFFVSVNEFIIRCIDNNNYIFLILNESIFAEMFPERPLAKKKHFDHELFIYGYDLAKRTFNVADFTFRGKYSFESVDMNKLCEGYESVVDDYIRLGHGGIILMQFKKNSNYNFDARLVKSNCLNYLQRGRVDDIYNIMSNSKIRETVVGVDVYNMFYDHFKKILDKELYYDYRAPHALYDHKFLMVKRLQYMKENGFIEDDNELQNYIEIRNRSLMLRNLYIKNSIANNISRDAIYKLIDGYKYIEEIEIKTMEKLVDKIII